MPVFLPALNSFNNGEITPLMYGRVDFQKYVNSAEIMQNCFVHKHGPFSKRSGTRFVHEVKYSNRYTKLKDFEFNRTQTYILELGHQYIRFYSDNGIIVSLNVPYEIASPYTEAELKGLKFAQSADVIYITHPNHAPRKLMRYGHTNWVLQVVDFKDGPYQEVNTDSNKKIRPAAKTGTGVTLTATGWTFAADDVGKHIRIKHGSTCGYAVLKTVNGATATADIKKDFGDITDTIDYRLGAWSPARGYPICCTFHQERLFFAGTKADPQKIWGSNTGDYENFAPTEVNNVIQDNNACTWTISADQVNAIIWLKAKDVLFIGTLGAEYKIDAEGGDKLLTPGNYVIKQISAHGSSDLEPQKINNALVFLQRAGRKLREIGYSFSEDRWNAVDLTVFGEHLTYTGIAEFAYQQEPNNIIWAIRNDGMLLGFTYDREQSVLAWHRHALGGTDVLVKSIASIANDDEGRDQLWLVVSRKINGATKQYVEVMEKEFDAATPQEDGFFVDCGLTYSGTPVNQISGLSHLEKEIVAVVLDGATQRAVQVNDGTISLDTFASTVHIGLPYTAIYKSVRMSMDQADGSSQGKRQKIHKVIIRVFRTLGLKYGQSIDDLQTIAARSIDDCMDSAPGLATGKEEVNFGSDWNNEPQVVLVSDMPLPMTILNIIPKMSIN